MRLARVFVDGAHDVDPWPSVAAATLLVFAARTAGTWIVPAGSRTYFERLAREVGRNLPGEFGARLVEDRRHAVRDQIGGLTVDLIDLVIREIAFSDVDVLQCHDEDHRRLRFAMIAGAACLVSLATYFAFPSHYIFFGILHAIAVASLLGVPFIRAPAWFPLIGAALVLVVNEYFSRSVFTAPAMAWTGLGTEVRASLDFIPVVPWLAPFLLGTAVAKIVPLERFEPAWPQWFPSNALVWPGKHSLAVYLLHQPVLIALIWMAVQITL